MKFESNYNLVVIDWGKVALNVQYWLPATNIQVIGAMVGKFIKELVENNLNSVQDFHLAGHSLGSHVMGYAGKWVKKNMNGQIIPKITGKFTVYYH